MDIIKRISGMLKNEIGFTLIELVMVIMILGILAAVAIPKYLDMSANAKTAEMKGIAAALGGGAATNYAACKLGGFTTASTTATAAAANPPCQVPVACSATHAALIATVPTADSSGGTITYGLVSGTIASGNTVTCSVTGDGVTQNWTLPVP